MAHHGDTVTVEDIFVIIDSERRKAWEGVPQGELPETSIAKIEVLNNISSQLARMNCAPRHSGDEAKAPIWKSGASLVHTDYADGHGETNVNKWAAWCCPVCDWFVGEQFIPTWAKGKPHTQQKCNFCSRCGQRIDWEAVD